VYSGSRLATIIGSMPTTAYIALGSNLGDRAAMLRAAIDKLNAVPGTKVVKVSTFLDNPAIGGPADSPPFLNAAAEVETDLDAETFLELLLSIEQSLGRYRHEKWGPRTIDLDLLLFGDLVIRTEKLTVPHPLMPERDFVLKPLVEIAAEVIHPVLKRRMRQIAAGGAG
jgi:2-amino-4-hydroxy-6-hydroxymethyldihydropteridine diphosphokinase